MRDEAANTVNGMDPSLHPGSPCSQSIFNEKNIAMAHGLFFNYVQELPLSLFFSGSKHCSNRSQTQAHIGGL